MVARILNIDECKRCRRHRPRHAKGYCIGCYQSYRRRLLDGSRESVHYTERQLNDLIAIRRETMPLESGDPLPESKHRRSRGELSKGYSQSPHGANCPLLKLVMRGEGGFSRALVEADKYLRDRPDADVHTAWQSKDGQRVRVTFGDGTTIEFPREAVKTSSIKDRREAAKSCRLAIFAVLERRGPLTAGQIAKALSRETEYVRVAIRGSDGWFVRVALTKDSAYAITPKATKEYATMNHGKPLAGSKAKGKRKLVGA